jgi:hypothetical protein
MRLDERREAIKLRGRNGEEGQVGGRWSEGGCTTQIRGRGVPIRTDRRVVVGSLTPSCKQLNA